MVKSKLLTYIFGLIFLSLTVSNFLPTGSCISMSEFLPAQQRSTIPIFDLYREDEIHFRGTATANLTIFLLNEDQYLKLNSSEDDLTFPTLYLVKISGISYDLEYVVPSDASGNYSLIIFNLNSEWIQIDYILNISSPRTNQTTVVVLTIIIIIGVIVYWFWKKRGYRYRK